MYPSDFLHDNIANWPRVKHRNVLTDTYWQEKELVNSHSKCNYFFIKSQIYASYGLDNDIFLS